MRRREVILGLSVAAAARPLSALSQQSLSIPRIGFLGAATATGYASQLQGLRLGLNELGYVEGKNIGIEFRWAEGRYDQLRNSRTNSSTRRLPSSSPTERPAPQQRNMHRRQSPSL